MTQDNGGSAFPTQTYDRDAAMNDIGVTVTDDPGMTLRDYFAAQALVGLLAGGCGYRADLLETEPYRIADIMMGARK